MPLLLLAKKERKEENLKPNSKNPKWP